MIEKKKEQNKRNQEFVEAENKIVAPFFELVLDEVITTANIQCGLPDPLKRIPSSDELRIELRTFVSQRLYGTKRRLRTMNGIDVIMKNLHRLPNAALTRKELIHSSEKLVKASEELAIKNEVTMAYFQKQLQESLDHSNSLKTDSERKELFDNITPWMHELGISEETFNSMYQIGCLVFDEHSFEEAVSVFQMLSLLNATCHEVWFSLALSHHRLEEYPEAIGYYAVAIFTDAFDLQSYINMAMCYSTLQATSEAHYSLSIAEEIVKEMKCSEKEKATMQKDIENIKNTLFKLS